MRSEKEKAYLAYKEKGLITVAVVACIVAYIIELFI